MRSFFAEAVFETDEGVKLQLVCDFYAIQVIEDVSGQDWDDIVPLLAKPPRSLSAIVVYGFLRKRQPDITTDEAMAVSYDKNSIALWAIIGSLIRAATNIADEEPPAQGAKKKSNGRSKGSAASG